MRVAAGFVILVISSAFPALAQTAPANYPATPEKSFAVVGNDPLNRPDATGFSCPIDMRVHQGMGGVMVAVDKDGVKRPVFAQRLRLFLNEIAPADSGRRIVSATVTVQGSNGKARMQPLDRDSGVNSANMERTVSVDLQNWGEPGVSGDSRLPGFTSASMVHLQSVTYDDGSTWKVSGRETCRVAPDPLMFIGQ